MHARIAPILLVSLAACSIQPALDNPRFVEFCGEVPCAWDVTGDISRVPTWHRSDLGLSLDSPGTRVSQLADNYACMRLSIRADISPTADVELEFDYGDNGSIEMQRRIPEGRYDEFVLRTGVPSNYRGAALRVTLQKRGTGTAIISQFYMERDEGCDATPSDFVAGPPGSKCSSDADCESGQCAHSQTPVRGGFGVLAAAHCSDCALDGSCEMGAACDVHAHCSSNVCVNGGCGCQDDEQCGEGAYCTAGVCSPCRRDDDCDAGESCAAPESYVRGPNRCLAPNALGRRRPDGVLCDNTEQCQSGRCDAAGNTATRCGGTCATGDDCSEGVCTVFIPEPALIERYAASDLSLLGGRFETPRDDFGLVSALYGSPEGLLLAMTGQPTMCTVAEER